MSTESPDPAVIPGQEDEMLSMQWGEEIYDDLQLWAGDQFAYTPWQWEAETVDVGC